MFLAHFLALSQIWPSFHLSQHYEWNVNKGLWIERKQKVKLNLERSMNARRLKIKKKFYAVWDKWKNEICLQYKKFVHRIFFSFACIYISAGQYCFTEFFFLSLISGKSSIFFHIWWVTISSISTAFFLSIYVNVKRKTNQNA